MHNTASFVSRITHRVLALAIVPSKLFFGGAIDFLSEEKRSIIQGSKYLSEDPESGW